MSSRVTIQWLIQLNVAFCTPSNFPNWFVTFFQEYLVEYFGKLELLIKLIIMNLYYRIQYTVYTVQ